MPKYLVNITDQMQSLLLQAANEQNANVSAVIRAAVAEYLFKLYGIEVEHKMEWGGSRKSGEHQESD